MQKKANKKITMLTNENVTLEGGFNLFLSHKKANNLSDDTILYYKRCFKPFATHFGLDSICCDINKDIIVQYILCLKEQNKLKDITINTHLRGIRAILYFFMEEGFTEEFQISLIKCDKTIKETYTEMELERLLKKPDVSSCSFVEYRNWVIECFAYGTASRLRTICNIKINDIDFNNDEIKYTTTKSRKQYIIPLASSLSKILKEYLQYRKGKNDDYLFCNSFGEQLTKDTLTSSIQTYNKNRGVNKTSLHLFRHTFAKNWILNGGDIFRLQKILGHSTLEMVKEYVNIFGNELKNDFDSFNPLEKMQDKIKTRSSIKRTKG